MIFFEFTTEAPNLEPVIMNEIEKVNNQRGTNYTLYFYKAEEGLIKVYLKK